MDEFLTRRELLGTMGTLAGGGGAALVATGSGRAASEERWPQFGHDRTNAGHTVASGPGPPVTERWTYGTGGGVSSSPAVVDGAVYVGSADGSVYALSAADGREEWSHGTGGGVGSSPAVVDGTVYVGSLDGSVYALSASGGRERWSSGTDGGVVSSPAVVDGTVYTGSRDGTVYALSAADGRERWTYETGDEIWSSPAVGDGTVYIGSRDGAVHAISTADGSGRWTYETGDWVESPPAVLDGTVYVGSLDGSVYALSATDGHEEWAFGADGGVASSPAVADGTVYVGSEDDRVYALSASDGSERWRFETGDRVFSSPAVADGTVYVGGVDGSVYALSASDGTERWTHDTEGPVFSSPAVVDGTVYVGGGDDRVYALASGGVTPSPTGGEAADARNALGSTTPGNLVAVGGSSGGWPPLELLATIVGGVAAGGGGLWWLRDRRSADGNPDEAVETAESAAGTDSPPSSSGNDSQALSGGEAADSGGAAVASTGSDGPVVPAAVVDRHLPETPPDVDTAPVTYGSLTDREVLHRGADATVVRAVHPGGDGERTVVLKEPRGAETLHRSAIEELVAGAETWSKLDDHDHIVHVLGYDADPLPWVAMEYMDGGTLAERAGDLDLPQALWTALCVSRAVHYAHRRGVTHLGLTPWNVLFREMPGDTWAWPKVSDWGVTGLLSTRSGTDSDPSPYAAPEQRGDAPGPTDDITDIYRLGAVCYELFTGQPPFGAAPDDATAHDPRPPSTVADVPSELDEILLPALARDRSDRYDSVVYIRDELGDLFLDA